jgi:hypothetical protein
MIFFDGARLHVSELLPLMGIFFFIPRMIYEYGERRWNDIDRGRPKDSEKTLSTTNHTLIDPAAKPGLHRMILPCIEYRKILLAE